MKRPDLSTLIERIRADMQGAGLRHSFSRILSYALAGSAHMLYGYTEQLAARSMPDSPDREMLETWCELFGILRKEPQKGKILLRLSATAKTTLSPGTRWRHVSGAVFCLTESVQIDQPDGEDSFFCEAAVICESPGSSGNPAKGEALMVTRTVADLKSEARIIRQLIRGTDAEDDDSLRQRLRERLRRPPQGGSVSDYIAWASSLPLVSRAWILPATHETRGQVRLCFVRKAPSLIPTEEETAEVRSELMKVCPATAELIVSAPLVRPLHLVIDAFPRTAEVLRQAEAEIRYLLEKKAAPRGYLDADMQRQSGVIHASDLHLALSAAPSEVHHSILSPEGNPEPERDGEMITFGSVSYAP